MALRIDGRYIDDAALLAEEARIRPALHAGMKGDPEDVIEERVREWARENVIEHVLLELEAWRDEEPIATEALEAAVAERKAIQPDCILPGPPSASDEELRREVERNLRIQRLIARIAGQEHTPSSDEAAAFYRENPEQFTSPEMVHAAHIVKNVDEKTTERKAYRAMEEIVEELGKGASFEDLADRHSDCPGRGGDLGWIGRGQMVDDFERVVFALAPGEVSRSFRSAFGFHIAKVYEKRECALRPLHEVEAEVERRLLEHKRRKAVEDFLDDLRARAHVEDVTGRGF